MSTITYSGRSGRATSFSRDVASAIACGFDPGQGHGDEFLPREPATLREAGLPDSEVESLLLKSLLVRTAASGRELAEQVKLRFGLIDDLLRELKARQLVVHRSAATANDFWFELTASGRELARGLSEKCGYADAAPVPLADYVRSVTLQSITRQKPSLSSVSQAFADLQIAPEKLARLAEAARFGRGLLLYGAPGNGKTSIAERLTRAFGQAVWIPRTISVEGEIVRLFDPSCHTEAPLSTDGRSADSVAVDRRWIRVQRPTVVAAGELTMANLEVSRNPLTGTAEAPLQLKSNCGTLVIDDFGRQRMSLRDLLNRWIVPLEKGHDFLTLPSGRQARVPFDQLVIFSTNMDPREVADEALLRRVPFKIEVADPTDEEFRRLWAATAAELGFRQRDDAAEYLVARHYRAAGRLFRFCHPRDLLLQIQGQCSLHGEPAEISPARIDAAVANYFGTL